MALTLNGYPTNVDAALISAPESLQGLVTIINEESLDVTSALISGGVLRFRTRTPHGYVDATYAATTFTVKETYYAMSTAFNSGETPVFFARVVNSFTDVPLVSSDVASINFSLYSYTANNIRTSGGTGYTPVENWTNIALNIADVIVDSPATDPRCPFLANLVYEPVTLTNNPFETPGNYRAIFTITPVSGNRIPVVINLRVN